MPLYDKDAYTPRGLTPTPPVQRGIRGTVSAPFRTPAEDIVRYRREAGEGGETLLENIAGSTWGMEPGEYRMQTSFLSNAVDEFDSRMQMLNNTSNRMDNMAVARLAETTRKHEALQKAFNNGKINQLELFRGVASLNQELGMFNWKTHTKGPGSAVGDTYEKDGIWYHNQAGKGPVPFDFTTEERQKRTVRDPVTGILVVPTAPGKEPKIYLPGEVHDVTVEQRQMDKYRRDIMDQADKIRQQDIIGEKTPQQIVEEARSLVDASYEQARQGVARLFGTEGRLTEAQQKRQVEQETGQAQPRNSMETQALDSDTAKVQENLLNQYGAIFKVDRATLKNIEVAGYTRQEALKAFTFLNQLKNEHPTANSLEDLPPEKRAGYLAALKLIKDLKIRATEQKDKTKKLGK